MFKNIYSILLLLHVLNRKIHYCLEINKQIGTIRRDCNDNSRLTAGTKKVAVELTVKIPQIGNFGTCNFMGHGSRHEVIGRVSPNFNNTEHQNHAKELNLLSAAMSHLIIDENKYIMDTVEKRLELKKNKLFSEVLNLKNFDNNPKICLDPNVRCTFQLGFNIQSECVDTKGNPMKPGFSVHSFRVPMLSDKDPSNHWAGHCGAFISSTGEGENRIYNVGPGLCCSTDDTLNEGNCPAEAGMLLRKYNKNARSAGNKTLKPNAAYCISILEIRKRPQSSRKRRSETFKYWIEGGPLSPNYILDKIHSEQKWETKNMEELETQVVTLDDNIHALGHSISGITEDLEATICAREMSEWKNIVRSDAFSLAEKVKTEIRAIFDQCQNGNLPEMVNKEALKAMCKGITNDKNGTHCEEIEALTKCDNRAYFLEDRNIVIHIDVTILLPVTETGLKCLDIEHFPIPSAMEIVRTNGESPDQNKNGKNEKQNEIFHFIRLMMPDRILIFYLESNKRQNIAFEACKNKDGINVCELGGPGELFDHSSCVDALVTKNVKHIRAVCPMNIRSGSRCEFRTIREGVIVMSHSDIDHKKLDESGIKGPFIKDKDVCKGPVCVYLKEKVPQEVICNGLRYMIDANESTELEQTIAEEVDLNITVNDFNFLGYHDVALNAIPKFKNPLNGVTYSPSNGLWHYIWLGILITGILTAAYTLFKICRCITDIINCCTCCANCLNRDCCLTPGRRASADSPEVNRGPNSIALLEYRN